MVNKEGIILMLPLPKIQVHQRIGMIHKVTISARCHCKTTVVHHWLYTIGCGTLHGWLSTVWVKKNPPSAVFWQFFPNGWEFFNQFLHTYYTFLSTLDYKFLFNYLQIWRSYAILLARPPNEFLHFNRSLTSKFAYWANDVTVDVMSYPTCLLTS